MVAEEVQKGIQAAHLENRAEGLGTPEAAAAERGMLVALVVKVVEVYSAAEEVAVLRKPALAL